MWFKISKSLNFDILPILALLSIAAWILYYLALPRVSKITKFSKLFAVLFAAFAALAIADIILLTGASRVLILLVLAIVFIVQYALCPSILMKGVSKVPVESIGREDILEFANNLAQERGFKGKIRVYAADLGVPNAFAISGITKKFVVIDKRLFEILNDRELKSVVAHEVGHIVHRDNGYLLGLSLFPYITHVLGYLLILNARGLLEYSEYYSYYGMRDQAMGHAMLAFIGGIIGVALVILSVLIMVPVLAFSRIKEHLADLVAVEKFGDDSVIRALEKIGGYIVHTGSRRLSKQV